MPGRSRPPVAENASENAGEGGRPAEGPILDPSDILDEGRVNPIAELRPDRLARDGVGIVVIPFESAAPLLLTEEFHRGRSGMIGLGGSGDTGRRLCLRVLRLAGVADGPALADKADKLRRCATGRGVIATSGVGASAYASVSGEAEAEYGSLTNRFRLLGGRGGVGFGERCFVGESSMRNDGDEAGELGDASPTAELADRRKGERGPRVGGCLGGDMSPLVEAEGVPSDPVRLSSS